MRRSTAITLGLLSAAAAAMIACHQKPARYCVDPDNQVVDDWDCQDSKDHSHSTFFHWYYGGAWGRVPIGTTLSGGSTVAPAGGYSTPRGPGFTTRGVFGGAGEGFSAHGGGEGGGE